MNEKLGIYVLAAAFVVVGVLNFVKAPVNVEVRSEDGKVQVVERSVGAAPGPEVFEHTYFHNGATIGGYIRSTSTDQTSATLLASDIFNRSASYTWLKVTPNFGNLTLTLPASSTLTAVAPKAGDRYTFLVENAASAATTTTIAAGTGMDLQEPDGQNVVIGQNNYAVVTLWRDSTGDFVVTVDEHIPAD